MLQQAAPNRRQKRQFTKDTSDRLGYFNSNKSRDLIVRGTDRRTTEVLTRHCFCVGVSEADDIFKL